MSGLHREGAQMDTCTSRHTCETYLIGSYRVINDISETAIASDISFNGKQLRYQFQIKMERGAASSYSFCLFECWNTYWSSRYNTLGVLKCRRNCTMSKLEALSFLLHHLPPVFLFLFWKPDQLWSKYIQEPQVQNTVKCDGRLTIGVTVIRA